MLYYSGAMVDMGVWGAWGGPMSVYQKKPFPYSHLFDVWRQYLSSVFDLDWKSFVWSLRRQ